MHSKGNVFACDVLRFSVEYQTTIICAALGETQSAYNAPYDELPFLDSIVVWNNSQDAFLSKELSEWAQTRRTEPIFFDEPIRLKRGKRIDSMKTMLRGRVELYADRLEFRGTQDAKAEPVSFPIESIEGEGVLKWNFFEFYQGECLPRCILKPDGIGQKVCRCLRGPARNFKRSFAWTVEVFSWRGKTAFSRENPVNDTYKN